MVLGHQVVNGFVKQSGVGERVTDSAPFFWRSGAQSVIHERRGLIWIELVKIADGLLSNLGGRIVKGFSNFAKSCVIRFKSGRSPAAMFHQLFSRTAQSRHVFSPAIVAFDHSISAPAASARGALGSTNTASDSGSAC